MKLNRRRNETLWTFTNVISKLRLVYFHGFFRVKVAKITKRKNVFVFVVGHAYTRWRDFMSFVNDFSQIHFPKLNFTYFKTSINLVLSFLILQNFEQRHMLKIIGIFRLPFYVPRESHNFFNSLEYSD